MKRAGFTMIELIFVIVILGILAAVAIPKLSATRDDAKIAKMSTNVATVIGDIGAYYTAKGSMGDNWNDMTNVKLKKDATTDSTAITAAAYLYDGTNQCIKFSISDSNLTVEDGSSTSGICGNVQTNVASQEKTYTFGGSTVTY